MRSKEWKNVLDYSDIGIDTFDPFDIIKYYKTKYKKKWKKNIDWILDQVSCLIVKKNILIEYETDLSLY